MSTQQYQGNQYVNCTSISPACPVEATIYGYYPSLGANAFFCAWFGVLTGAQVLLGWKYKTWLFSLAAVLGCLTETIGYVGRIIMHSNPWSDAGFETQICCLIIAPAFLSAAIYLTLKHIVVGFGERYSFIKPNSYTYIFIACDLLSLVLQGAGGGIAASANGKTSTQKTGNDLMLAGIVWQVATLLVFGSLAGWYLSRVWGHRMALSPASAGYRNTLAFKLFMSSLALAFLTVFVRCIYRIPEMSGGWRNSLMQNDNDFIALDSAMIAIASFCLTVFHPGFCFPQMVPGKVVFVDEEKVMARKESDNGS